MRIGCLDTESAETPEVCLGSIILDNPASNHVQLNGWMHAVRS